MGLGEVALTIGSLVYSVQAIQGEFVDDRWAALGWSAGAALSILAACAIVLRVDRPMRFGGPRPLYPGGSRTLLLVSLGTLLAALGVASYGALNGVTALTFIGLLAGVTIGAAMAFRARDSLRTAEQAYAQLDLAMIESERSHDALVVGNEALASVNAELRVTQAAIVGVLNLADERTDGRLRKLIEDTDGELAALLEQLLDREGDT
jgi:hypothetical protein